MGARGGDERGQGASRHSRVSHAEFADCRKKLNESFEYVFDIWTRSVSDPPLHLTYTGNAP